MLITPNLQLPYIDVNEAQREVVHNEAIRGLDALVQLAVLDRDLAAPPLSPDDGERWIVAASPSGGWAGHAGDIAVWQDGAWRFYEPRTGWLAYVLDEGALLAWDGDSWEPAIDVLGGAGELQNVNLLGVGTTADATNPFSAKLNNALWTARTVAEGGDGHLRYKMSKESAAKTLSLLLQTNFSGRAELGLTGDDDFHFKVSADGASWLEAIVIDKDTAEVSFPHTSIGGGGATEMARRVNGLTPYENLVVKHVGSAQVDIDADAVVLFDGSGNARRFASLNETLAITSSGANGLDTGAEGASRWYHIWAIGKSDGTLDGLLSESATAPTLPTGYTYKGYLGAVRNNGSSNFVAFSQRGNEVSFKSAVRVVNGAAAANYANADLSGDGGVPPTAVAVLFALTLGLSSGTGACYIEVGPAGSGTDSTYGSQKFETPNGSTSGLTYSTGFIAMVTAQQVAYYVVGANQANSLQVMAFRY